MRLHESPRFKMASIKARATFSTKSKSEGMQKIDHLSRKKTVENPVSIPLGTNPEFKKSTSQTLRKRFPESISLFP
jgi:hypothetical protein